MSDTPDPALTPVAPRKMPKAAVIAIVVVAVVALAIYGYRTISFGSTHVGTDDAYVTGDLVDVSPTAPGMLVEMNVQEGQFVHKGDPIAKLDTSGPQAALAQAEANLRAAESQVPQAEAAYDYARLSTDAAIQGSQAAIMAQTARTSGARLQAGLTRNTVSLQIAQAESQLEAAKAQAAQAMAGTETARAGVAAAEQAIVTAQRQCDASQTQVTSAQANAVRARKDRDRYAKLVATEAITRQQFDAAQAASIAADAQYEGAKEQAEAAKSGVAQARAALTQAKAQLVAIEKQAEAAASQVHVVQAALGLARSAETNVDIAGANTESSQGMEGQATAQLSSAEAGTKQVTLRQSQIATAKAQVQQAQAALDSARVHLRDCSLLAPCDGYVVKRTVNVGTAINPGQTVATITRGTDVWVMANFKETQLAEVKEGQPVDIDVDAFPGVIFRGKVLHILRATGSATTLLPPDNSTGNFTKVVQRVPIKITIEPKSGSNAPILLQGMSVTATIDTSSRGSK